jgi:16S rRNA (cytosine1402-N4)-methyltransferase
MSRASEAQNNQSLPHQPVLYHEIINALHPMSPGCYVDATVGAGGHAFGILEKSSPDGKLLGLDIDPQALGLAETRLSAFGDRKILRQASYTSLQDQLASLGWIRVQGILIDLGVSSMQIDTPERGFSFQSEGALDMRFDPENKTTAADLVNHLPEKELAKILWGYGEERFANRIARAICQSRPIHTTLELAEVIKKAVRSSHDHLHPATRTFQALRIAVNDELGALTTFLPQAIAVLEPGARLAVISFHSLEDRIVKQFFNRESKDCICPPKQPTCTCDHKAILKVITRHPIGPADLEIDQNPRARSSRLRVAERLEVA